MARELELPNGETVTSEDVFLYNNYPYRVRFPDDGTAAGEDGDRAAGEDETAASDGGEAGPDDGAASAADGDSPDDATTTAGPDDYEFELSPLYWGGGEMDIPFRDRAALVEQWGSDSRGTLTAEEWEQWLREARHDDRFGGDELDALARELPTPGGGLVTRIRQALGF